MKVTQVITRYLEYDMGDRLWNSSQRWSKKPIVLAFVETDTGLLGVGEAWVGGASPRALIQTIEDDIAPLLIGEDPRMIGALWTAAFRTTLISARRGIVSAALGAVDTALWDLLGKIANMPLYQLLGAERESVYCYASAGLYGLGKGLDELALEMRGYIDQGFNAVKLKVGGVPLPEDVQRVAAVREAVGASAKVMVDANYMLDVPQSIAMARAFESYDIYWLEAPVFPDDIAGQAAVAERSPIPICGNETEHGKDRFRELIDQRAVSYVQFDLAACGGISEGRRIAALADAFHLPCTLHASSSAVLFAATLHLAAATANLDSVEYHQLHQWLFDQTAADTFAVAPGGLVKPPPGPGLGLDLHYEQLNTSVYRP